jgi:hypothetical protein
MSTVNVDMGFCGNTHKVTVSKRADGEFDVIIDTTCGNIRAYGMLLKKMTINDIMGSSSPAFSDDKMKLITPGCLVPSAVMAAAWMEVGMIPEDRIKGAVNSVTF